MKVRLFGVPHFGREDEPYNNTKGKVYFVLITHPGQWVRPLDLASSTGLNVRSLYTLMRKWTGPTWHTLQRRKIAGFYCYQITVKGKEWFARWYEIMPINRWKREIREWQTLQEAETAAGTWYRDAAGQMKFKSNT